MEECIKVKCVDYTYDGLGICKYDNEVIFVNGLIKGEEAIVNILRKEKSYYVGEIKELLTRSENRVDSVCSCYEDCGGCHLLHLSYKEQLEFKKNHVQNCLKRIGDLDIKVNDVVANPNPTHYRNKVQVSFSMDYKGNVIGGFYKQKTHQIIDSETCLLQNDITSQIINYFKGLLKKYEIEPFDRTNNYGSVRHLLVRVGYYSKEVMLVIITRTNNLPHQKALISELTKKFPQIVSIIHNVNDRNSNIILGNKEKCIFGKPYISDYLCGLKFNISSKSFYQVNPPQTEKLYSIAIESAKLTKDDVVIDAYCGIGTIGLIASKHCKEVVGVEIVKEAIENAQNNMKLNNIQNAKYYADDASKFIERYSKTNKKPTTVFVDPPRAGCDRKFIDTLLKMKPEKIVYISCDPSSLSRDLKILKSGYNITSVTPVDMFSNTYHVECIAVLSRND